MKRHHRQLGLGRLCRLFGKSRQAFYDHNHRDNAHQIKKSVIVDAVKLAKASVSDSMGAIKTLKIIRPELENHQISIGRDRFFRLLKDHNLAGKDKKKICYYH